jgi:hypothetical protein
LIEGVHLKAARIARYALLAVAAPVLLAATFGDPDDDAVVPDQAVADAQERVDLTERCRTLLTTFDREARNRPDTDEKQSAMHLRTTAASECSDPASLSLMENGIDDLHMALRIIGAEK